VVMVVSPNDGRLVGAQAHRQPRRRRDLATADEATALCPTQANVGRRIHVACAKSDSTTRATRSRVRTVFTPLYCHNMQQRLLKALEHTAPYHPLSRARLVDKAGTILPQKPNTNWNPAFRTTMLSLLKPGTSGDLPPSMTLSGCVTESKFSTFDNNGKAEDQNSNIQRGERRTRNGERGGCPTTTAEPVLSPRWFREGYAYNLRLKTKKSTGWTSAKLLVADAPTSTPDVTVLAGVAALNHSEPELWESVSRLVLVESPDTATELS